MKNELLKLLEDKKTNFANNTKNKFSGVYLSNKRDNLNYRNTFDHAGAILKSLHNIGHTTNIDWQYFPNDIDRYAPLEAKFFEKCSTKDKTPLIKEPIIPITDRYYSMGIQNFSEFSLKYNPQNDNLKVGDTIYFGNYKKQILNITNESVLINGFIAHDRVPAIFTKKNNRCFAKRVQIMPLQYSDTLYWQNGVWVGDNTAKIFVTDSKSAKPGDSIEFEEGFKRIITYVHPNGIIELSGERLDNFKNGFGTKIFLNTLANKKEQKEYSVQNECNTSKPQRIKVNSNFSKRITKGNYLMFDDGYPRFIENIEEGIISLSQFISNERDGLKIFKFTENEISNIHTNKIEILDFNTGVTNEIIKLPPLNPNYGISSSEPRYFLYLDKNNTIWDRPDYIEYERLISNALCIGPLRTSAPEIWGSYTGINNILYDTVHPINRDYLIHVLGNKERQDYLEGFVRKQPEFVQTSSENSDNSNFHSWALNTSWDFFEKVISNYEPCYTHDYMVMWKKIGSFNHSNSESNKYYDLGSNFPISIDLKNNSDLTSTTQLRLCTVEINYSIKNDFSKIPIFGNLNRYIITKNGAINALPVQLSTTTNEFRFPVLAKIGDTVKLDLHVIHPIFNSSINVSSIRYYYNQATSKNIAAMFVPINYNDPEIYLETFMKQNK